ncbi:hypothetical protein, partial [Oceanobacillus sp. FSL W7-1309]|uniref:hypothetical protein n=1 Tax=Oceanobacillus sp. FSL W7-1309 TaxID=2954539 RepID=UPI0030F5BCA3
MPPIPPCLLLTERSNIFLDPDVILPDSNHTVTPPDGGDAVPGGDDTGPPDGDTGPGGDDTGPPDGDTGPGGDDTGPPDGDTGPDGDD